MIPVVIALTVSFFMYGKSDDNIQCEHFWKREYSSNIPGVPQYNYELMDKGVKLAGIIAASNKGLLYIFLLTFRC